MTEWLVNGKLGAVWKEIVNGLVRGVNFSGTFLSVLVRDDQRRWLTLEVRLKPGNFLGKLLSYDNFASKFTNLCTGSYIYQVHEHRKGNNSRAWELVYRPYDQIKIAINTWSGVGLAFLCVRRLPEDGTPLSKHVAMILIVNCVLLYVFYCTLLCAFVGQYIELGLTACSCLWRWIGSFQLILGLSGTLLPVHFDFVACHRKFCTYLSSHYVLFPSWCQWIFHWHKILLIALWPWGRLSL